MNNEILIMDNAQQDETRQDQQVPTILSVLQNHSNKKNK